MLARAITRAPPVPSTWTEPPPTPTAEPAADAAMPAAFAPRHLAARLGQLAVLGAVVVLLVGALPGLGEVRERFAGIGPGWIAVSALLQLGSVAAFVVAFRGVFCRRMPWRFAGQVALSEQAANVLVPAGGAGGLALGAWALRRGGMSTGHIARRSVAFWLVTSSTNFLTVAAVGTLVALGLLGGGVAPALAAVPAALAVAAIAAVLALPRLLARAAAGGAEHEGRGRRVLRAGAGSVTEGVRDTVALLRDGRPSVVGGAWGYMALDVAALWAAFQATGAAPAVGAFLLAYLLGQLGGLIPLPGGIGGTDGGLVAALVLFGSPLAAAAAAVLLYRAFQLGLPALLGAGAFATLRRTLAADERPAARCEPLAEPLPA
jgi:uncharacterized membrane protein YbhN (UPF0104 family)